MIFITVGTTNKGFDRLLIECDRIAKNNNLTFFAQVGSSKYKPLNIPFKEWLTRDEMDYYYSSAAAFVIHGGFGTLSETLKYKKPTFVVTRKFENGEAVNNQLDLVLKLNELGYIHYVENLKTIEGLLLGKTEPIVATENLETTIPTIINNYITDLAKTQ